MNNYTLFSLIVALAIFMGYINERVFKQQATIAIMSGSLICLLYTSDAADE